MSEEMLTWQYQNDTYYVKLQTAHVSEASMIGSWIAIGYSGPGDNTRASGGAGGTTSKTGNFEYADASSGFSGETVALSSSDVTGWSAKNIYTLNNCTEKTGDWTIKVKKGSVAGEAAFTASVNAAGCPELTPTFKNIGN